MAYDRVAPKEIDALSEVLWEDSPTEEDAGGVRMAFEDPAVRWWSWRPSSRSVVFDTRSLAGGL